MSTSMLREFANQWLIERYGQDFAIPETGDGLSSLMQSLQPPSGNTHLPNQAAGNTSSELLGNPEDDDDPQEAANSIADILYHLFGDDAMSHLDELLPMMQQYARDWDESKITRHPKGKREGGRFAAKHTAESLASMHSNIASSLKGQRSGDSVKELASHLGNLTIGQLHDLKKQYGISASGRTKQDLVAKIADRLDRGRRNPEEQQPAPEPPQEQPPQEEQSAPPEMPPAAPQAPAGPPLPSPLQKAVERRKSILEKHLGPQEEPFQLKSEPAPRPAAAVKLTNPNTKQKALFDDGGDDLPGQQTLFDDIGIQGQPESSGMMEIPMGELPQPLQGSARGQLMMGIQDGSRPSAQQSLDPNTLENTQSDLATTPYEGDPHVPITVAKVGGKNYVLDGHHRKHEAIKGGRPVVANVADLDTPSPRNYPDNLNKPADQQTLYSPPERPEEAFAAPVTQRQQSQASADISSQPDSPPADTSDGEVRQDTSLSRLEKLRKTANGDPNSAMTQSARRMLKKNFGEDWDKPPEPPKAFQTRIATDITPGADPALNTPEAKRMNDMIVNNESFFESFAHKYPGVEADILAQDVRLALFDASPTFQGGEDQMRALASSIAGNKYKDMLSHKHAKKRDESSTSSLDAPVGENGETMAGNVMDRASTGGRDSRMFDVLHKHISHLPDNLRSFADLLMQGMSNREAAKNLGLSHTTGSVRAQEIAEYLTPYMHAEQYRRKNPRLFAVVESEVDRYFREHTLLDPQIERYFMFSGKSGITGMLLRGLLTALAFSLVNGMSGGHPANAGSPTPKQPTQPAPAPAPFSDNPFADLDQKPSHPMGDRPSLQPTSHADRQKLDSGFDTPLSDDKPDSFDDWFGDGVHDSDSPNDVETQPMRPQTQTEQVPPTPSPAPVSPPEPSGLSPDQSRILDRSGYKDPAKQPDTYPVAKPKPPGGPTQQEFDADPDNPPQAPKGGSSWPSWHDPSHPRHKKGDSQGRGGQFAPKGDGTTQGEMEFPEGDDAPAETPSEPDTSFDPSSFGGESPEPVPELAPLAPAPQSSPSNRPVRKAWHAGMNQGTVEFESQEHADMHELGSKLKNHTKGKGNSRGLNGVTEREKQRVAELTNKYAEKFGMSPSEVQWHARDVNAASKAQAAKFQDGEHRPLKYSPPKSKATNPAATEPEPVRQPKPEWEKKETPQEPEPSAAEAPPQAESESASESTPVPQKKQPKWTKGWH